MNKLVSIILSHIGCDHPLLVQFCEYAAPDSNHLPCYGNFLNTKSIKAAPKTSCGGYYVGLSGCNPVNENSDIEISV